MSYIDLPAPISYSQYLVDIGSDPRAKIDQIRVLVQNTFQFLAAILVNDCHRLSVLETLPEIATATSLNLGDLISQIYICSKALLPNLEQTFVPELVSLYGSPGQDARERRRRCQALVERRNEDTHASSLAHTNVMLEEVTSTVKPLLEELQILENYTLLAVTNVELNPPKTVARINGKQCHGPMNRYKTHSFLAGEFPSRGELILVKSDRSSWLSLRPWFLFSIDPGHQNQGIEEVMILNEFKNRGLKYIGLISGEDYRIEGDEWLIFSPYSLAETSTSVPSVQGIEQPPKARVEEPTSEALESSVESGPEASEDLKNPIALRAIEIISKIPDVNLKSASDGGTFVMAQTPSRDVPIALINGDGKVQILLAAVRRAAQDSLFSSQVLETLLASAGIQSYSSIVDIDDVNKAAEFIENLAKRQRA